MTDTLTTVQKAPILGPDNQQLGVVGQTLYQATSSDPTVVAISWENWKAVAVAQGIGEATITVTRLSDGAVATTDVEVVAEALPLSASRSGRPCISRPRCRPLPMVRWGSVRIGVDTPPRTV